MVGLSQTQRETSDRRQKSTVLVIGGHDPSGAGILADIETCAANRCLALTIVTVLTSQNTRTFKQMVKIESNFILQQLDLLLEEFTPDAIKIGLIPTVNLCVELADYIGKNLIACPIVLDPVLKTGCSDTDLVDEKVPEAMAKYLAPLVTIMTPNRDELSSLGGDANPELATEKLLDLGAGAILATDQKATDSSIINVFSSQRLQAKIEFTMERYPELSHGTGCTLSSALACGLAKGKNLRQSLILAQQYTHSTVRHSMSYNTKQSLPNRLYKL